MSTVLFLANSLGAQTIINGGFEDDKIVPGGNNPTTPFGWSYAAGDPWVTSVTAPDAVVGAVDNAYLQAGSSMVIYQEIFGLVVGQDYEITYLVGNSAYPSPGPQVGTVSIAGNLVSHYDGSGLPIPMAPGSIRFTAGATSELLYVYSKSNTTSFDEFVITPIPEPSSLFLIGVGAFSVLVKRRR